ncbi:unnamed protein product [Brassica rapa]|uniref:Uncharacterized protein n=1 Tax=Brassica campestris TaxID=3711 RepID=A0A8D9H7V3_BRACM|nr:unnamed protein product [Brassica rapa]
MILLDAEVFLNRECQSSCSTGMKKDKWCCYVSCSRWTKELQRTGSAFTCVTCNNANVVGVLRYSMEHHLPGLPATEVSAKVDVGGSTLEGAPTT